MICGIQRDKVAEVSRIGNGEEMGQGKFVLSFGYKKYNYLSTTKVSMSEARAIIWL